MNTLLITFSGYVEITSQLLTFQNEIVILPSGVPRGCGWGRVITLPNLSHVRYTQNIVGKVSNLVSITPISLWEEREKEVLNCFDDKSEKFSKYSCQSIEIHTCSGHQFSCQIYRCQDSMNRQQEVNKQPQVEKHNSSFNQIILRDQIHILQPSRPPRFRSWHAIDFFQLLQWYNWYQKLVLYWRQRSREFL